ncbi:MAG: transketolase C-terminal domain-containing protein [Verrucomicrobiota bacterium]
MRQTCLNMVYELAKQDRRVVFIGSDLGIGTLKQFKAEMPDRYFMEGICEQALVGLCAGLALEGKIVYFNTIATFITRRCFDQIAIDLCLHNVPVRLIGSGGGMVYAPLGPTHLATEDIAIMRALPNMTIVAPADATEMRRFMTTSVNPPGPIYIRLGKGGDPIVTSADQQFALGKTYRLHAGNDVLILSTGICAKIALDAATTRSGVGVIHVPTIKPLDAAAILAAVAKAKVVVTIEEHTLPGGFGSAIAELILEAGLTPRFKRLGIPDVFPDKYGSQASLLEYYGITAANLTKTIQQLWANS